jgi:hypothetical protein
LSFLNVATSAAALVGEIVQLPFGTVPTGFLECNGQAVSRDSYPELFNAIGTTYGLGSIINTFRVPDYRGYFLRGWSHDSTTGIDPDAQSRNNGNVVGSTQGFCNAHHQHIIPRDWRTPGSLDAVGESESGGTPDNLGLSAGDFPFKTLINADGGCAEARPSNVAVMYAIRALPADTFLQSSIDIVMRQMPIFLHLLK